MSGASCSHSDSLQAKFHKGLRLFALRATGQRHPNLRENHVYWYFVYVLPSAAAKTEPPETDGDEVVEVGSYNIDVYMWNVDAVFFRVSPKLLDSLLEGHKGCRILLPVARGCFNKQISALNLGVSAGWKIWLCELSWQCTRSWSKWNQPFET